MLLQRNLFKHHDFIAYFQRLSQEFSLCGIDGLWGMFVNHNIFAFNLVKRFIHFVLFQICQFIRSNTPVDFSLLSANELIGGGSNTFVFEELQPHTLSDHAYSVNTKFVFKTYTTEAELSQSGFLDKSFLICNLPLNVLVLKLNAAQLRIVATCHQLSIHSKMHNAGVQSTIIDHICHTCEQFVSVFQVIDEEKRMKQAKTVASRAVKKYQKRKGDQYKLDHLAAVKKHQEKQGDQYKLDHLAAVKKHQEKQGDQYKLDNLAAVKKHQVQQGDQYKLDHLTSAKKHQEKQGDQYKLDNLTSAKKYQEKQGVQYKLDNLASVKRHQEKQGLKYKEANLIAVKKYQERKHKSEFPPSPLSLKLQQTVISNACEDMAPAQFSESGCAVCGRLTPIIDLLKLSEMNVDLKILSRPNVTQKERSNSKDSIQDLDGPILDESLDKICQQCHTSLLQGKMPLMALANGKWIGNIPSELSDLSFAEQLLIARVRHNRCIVKVSSGMHKMRANAITFANPIPKVYDTLPPPIEELDEVLAFIYTGPCKPTKSDFERTPLLVRKNKVRAALEWLKLNHCDYYDLEISQRNLDKYPEDGPPVVVDYHQSFTNKDPESTAVNDMEEEEGTETGKCPFVVHGLTGEEYTTKSIKAIKAIALQHLTSNRKILAIGHEAHPESIYNNPQLFPQMMPWLFPYGLGGIGNNLQQGHISDIAHKRHLLMYHDKRFQKDPYFPLIAFNHEQIKQSTTAGYLLAEKSKFDDISKRLMDVDMGTLSKLSKQMEDGQRVVPETDEEKLCFQLIKDLDHVGGHVKGSVTSKKYMRNEIWSLISHLGAPSWFITFAPADNKHPISLYFADTDEQFSPKLRGYDERYRLIAHNPVAGARFFHFMCQMVIKHVLGVGEDHPGIYGDTAAYYGVVEQQGRLTLHLHLLLWIVSSLSPQEIRDRIMDPNSDFQKKMVEYLESVHVGEFLTGTMADVKAAVETKSQEKDYQDPTQTLPESPPPVCDNSGDNCCNCKSLESWWDRFKHTVDDLIFKSNVHNCRRNQSSSEKADKKDRPSCINKHGNCKARFPRQIYEQTEVDPKTGALNMRKGEAWINTLTPTLTYLLRSNSDVTSLLSGTAIKAIVAYVSDYVTKPGLKTYSIFDTIRSVFNRNSEMIGGTLQRKEKARRLVTQIINSLTSKMEIGGPMASLYLLGNPDHYTSHDFVTVYWKNFVREAMKPWRTSEDTKDNDLEQVVVQKVADEYVGFSSVHDYIYRPAAYNDKSLYEWLQKSKRVKIPSKMARHMIESDGEDELDLIEHPIHENIKASQIEQNVSDVETDDLNIGNDNLDVDDSDFIVNEDDDSQSDSDSTTSHDNTANSNTKIDLSEQFLHDHPLSKTHIIKFDKRRKNSLVLNFVGGSLPRRDHGDREYYCATMLTLFKPWRNGNDLKDQDYSWDETFSKHEFTQHQLQLMDNFNIRYECNDARDDFSAQLKKGDTNDKFPQWMSLEMIDELDEIDQNDQGADFGDGEGISDHDYGVNQYSTLGKHGRLMKEQMIATENSMRSAGWLDDSPNGVADVPDMQLQPETVQTGVKWKATVHDKRQEVLAERNKNIPSVTSHSKGKYSQDPNENDVKIVDQSYLRHDFKAKTEAAQKHIDQCVNDFNLNTEQNRAFRIIANHATTPQSEQLKMYLGGMGGTGKSQVFKALMQFFTLRSESHRFVVLGPTGTSAALLCGSTYHSFLGIGMGDTMRNIAQVKARLEGVDYILVDEVSMLSCHDMYKISSQLAKALNVYDIPFGGVNMVFAGDFAQLPPVGGAALYSGVVGTQVESGLKPHQQEAAIGKALWHQITTVVILRQNMRQKSQTKEDASLRAALVNMRYGACTPNDIQFLRTLVAGKRLDQPNVAAKQFRNAAIICGVHTQKDQINQLGCERFAAETHQNLTNFYSVDKWGKESDPATKQKWGKSKAAPKSKHKSNEIDFDVQQEIWKVRHGATDHFPGKLSLCLGMPVMIRNNDATELCITKGQEGFVVGWQSIKGPHGKRVLDTLFVKLDNPPQLVQIPGLPDNVVPIVKNTKTINCIFPSDLKESIERQQVWVLPNFAMTAHAAQGKTRPYNVVHLNSCFNHMSYYTALSRSASAAGTIIIQGFDSNVITRGCSGYLRQEFREQEILDDITRLRYENKLPDHVDGILRNVLIRQYQKWKGTDYVPDKTDSPLKWSSQNPLPLLAVVTDSPWQLVDKSKSKSKSNVQSHTSTSFVPAQGSLAITTSQKRKAEEPIMSPIQGKVRRITNNAENNDNIPMGLRWDGDNYSCAYDALFVILYNIWIDRPDIWTRQFHNIGNKYLTALTNGFKEVLENKSTLENVRDSIRNQLHNIDPVKFPTGHKGASVTNLALEMFKTKAVVTLSQQLCTECEYEGDEKNNRLGYVIEADPSVTTSTSKWLNSIHVKTQENCPECAHAMEHPIYYKSPPKLLIMEYPGQDIKTSHCLRFVDEDKEETVKLHLRGIIYHGGFHFTSRVISAAGDVCYHDGMVTGRSCVYDSHLKLLSYEDLGHCKNRNLVLAVYAQ
jgi:hypothetical protein